MLTDDLKASVNGLTTSVDNLAARQPVPTPLGGSVSDVDVLQAITDVKTQSARIDTLVNPNPPVPPVTQAPATAPATTTNFADPLAKT